MPMELLPYSSFYTSVASLQSAPRRMPANYHVFNPDPSTPTEIGIFLTSTTEPTVEGTFSNATGAWRSDIELTSGEYYYIYGYMPKAAAATASAAPLNGSYANGTVMTLTGLDPVSTNDLCVVVGVKQGERRAVDITVVDNLLQGVFLFRGKNAEEGNFVYLLLDHIYASIGFNMKVDAGYNALRTIKLKEVSIKSPNASKVTANVTITANTNDKNPISSVVWNRQGGEMTEVIYTYTPEDTSDPTDTGKALTTSMFHISECMIANIMNSSTDKPLLLHTVYDVYDKAGNLVRSDCVSENRIPSVSTLDHSERTQLQLIVKPTYLYVLSDPDLNNPSVEFI